MKKQELICKVIFKDFQEFRATELYFFLMSIIPKGTNYMLFEKTIWDLQIPIAKDQNLDGMISTLLEKKYSHFVVFGTAWAKNLLNIVCLVSIIATKNLVMELDIRIALELFLCFSYYLQTKGIALDC